MVADCWSPAHIRPTTVHTRSPLGGLYPFYPRCAAHGHAIAPPTFFGPGWPRSLFYATHTVIKSSGANRHVVRHSAIFFLLFAAARPPPTASSAAAASPPFGVTGWRHPHPPGKRHQRSTAVPVRFSLRRDFFPPRTPPFLWPCARVGAPTIVLFFRLFAGVLPLAPCHALVILIVSWTDWGHVRQRTSVW